MKMKEEERSDLGSRGVCHTTSGNLVSATSEARSEGR